MRYLVLVMLLVALACGGNGEGTERTDSASESGRESGSIESGGEGSDSGGSEPAGEPVSGSGGGESGETTEVGGEGSSNPQLTIDDTFDRVMAGARLVLSYDKTRGAFLGSVLNTWPSTLTRVRVEVHLSNGVELGPTTPQDLSPGQSININLDATGQVFDTWIGHVEHGSGEAGGSESVGEGGSEGAEGGSGSEAGEVAMSSPIVPLDQTWQGVLGGLEVYAMFTGGVVQAQVTNATSQVLCYVQSEPHLKQGQQTVGELGPQMLGDLQPGEALVSSLVVADEATMAGVSFDGYVIHLEVFDCAGPGPIPHSIPTDKPTPNAQLVISHASGMSGCSSLCVPSQHLRRTIDLTLAA